MAGDRSDSTAITHLAVTVADVVVALETNATTDRTAVLRVTPPFGGRMRARIHVGPPPAESGGQAPIRIEPSRLLTGDAPSYPRPDETEDALRADPEATYSPAAHRARHARAVDRWREGVGDALAEEVTLPTPDGETTVTVRPLG